jgi:hypothetical protein
LIRISLDQTRRFSLRDIKDHKIGAAETGNGNYRMSLRAEKQPVIGRLIESRIVKLKRIHIKQAVGRAGIIQRADFNRIFTVIQLR